MRETERQQCGRVGNKGDVRSGKRGREERELRERENRKRDGGRGRAGRKKKTNIKGIVCNCVYITSPNPIIPLAVISH